MSRIKLSTGGLLQRDYSSVEARVAAYVAETNPELALLLKFVDQGDNIHLAMAQEVFHTKLTTKDQYERAKAYNYRLIYGAYDNNPYRWW